MQDSTRHHSSPGSKENEIKANGLCSLIGIQTTERSSILKFPKYCGYWISTKRVCVSGLVLKPADLLLFRPQIMMTSVMLEILRPQVPRLGFMNSARSTLNHALSSTIAIFSESSLLHIAQAYELRNKHTHTEISFFLFEQIKFMFLTCIMFITWLSY